MHDAASRTWRPLCMLLMLRASSHGAFFSKALGVFKTMAPEFRLAGAERMRC